VGNDTQHEDTAHSNKKNETISITLDTERCYVPEKLTIDKRSGLFSRCITNEEKRFFNIHTWRAW
jgi:hypothetical protein